MSNTKIIWLLDITCVCIDSSCTLGPVPWQAGTGAIPSPEPPG